MITLASRQIHAPEAYRRQASTSPVYTRKADNFSMPEHQLQRRGGPRSSRWHGSWLLAAENPHENKLDDVRVNEQELGAAIALGTCDGVH